MNSQRVHTRARSFLCTPLGGDTARWSEQEAASTPCGGAAGRVRVNQLRHCCNRFLEKLAVVVADEFSLSWLFQDLVLGRNWWLQLATLGISCGKITGSFEKKIDEENLQILAFSCSENDGHVVWLQSPVLYLVVHCVLISHYPWRISTD